MAVTTRRVARRPSRAELDANIALLFALRPAYSPPNSLQLLACYELVGTDVRAREAAQTLTGIDLDHLLPPMIVALTALALALFKATS